MFEENKVFKKFCGTFKGLKRQFSRIKKPNKITEYEVPRDPTKTNLKIKDFDPAILLDEEYTKDEEVSKKKEEKLYGKRPEIPVEPEHVEVPHLEERDLRVRSIRDELHGDDDLDWKRRRDEFRRKKEEGQPTFLVT